MSVFDFQRTLVVAKSRFIQPPPSQLLPHLSLFAQSISFRLLRGKAEMGSQRSFCGRYSTFYSVLKIRMRPFKINGAVDRNFNDLDVWCLFLEMALENLDVGFTYCGAKQLAKIGERVVQISWRKHLFGINDPDRKS